MVRIIRPLLLVMILMGWNSRAQSNESYFKIFKKKFKFLQQDGWLIKSCQPPGRPTLDCTAVKLIDKDTTIYAHLRRTLNLDFKLEHTVQLSKEYRSGEIYHIILLNEELKPMCHYTDYYASGRTFYFGEYYFKYINDFLGSEQKRFFEQHLDSLIKIPGSNLPPLPALQDK